MSVLKSDADTPRRTRLEETGLPCLVIIVDGQAQIALHGDVANALSHAFDHGVKAQAPSTGRQGASAPCAGGLLHVEGFRG